MPKTTSQKPPIPGEVSGALEFLCQVRHELSKVVWPTRAETIRLTAIVVGVSIFIAVYIGLLDLAFTNFVNAFIIR